MPTNSFLTRSLTILVATLLSACGSTSPSGPEVLTNNSALNSANNETASFTLDDIRLFDKTVGQLKAYNADAKLWTQNIQLYADQTQPGSAAKYVGYSSQLHNTAEPARCNRGSIVNIQKALAVHPSSLAVLAYALNCAERFERHDQQEAVARSITMVTDQLVSPRTNGSSASQPLLVREIYEGEYLLALAGIEVFETEMWIESERVLILHHGIDQTNNTYSLSFADQSDFFMQSFSAAMSNSGVQTRPSKSALMGIKSKALVNGKHYPILLWNIRQLMYAGEYSKVITQITAQGYTTPSAVSMLAQAYMATNDAAGIASIEDNLLFYANLGIPESQAVAAMMLLKMDNSDGLDYSQQWDVHNSKEIQSDIDLVVRSFKQHVELIGLESASLAWTRTLLGDGASQDYLMEVVKHFDAPTIASWKQALDYTLNNQNQRTSELDIRIERFTQILNSVNERPSTLHQGSL